VFYSGNNIGTSLGAYKLNNSRRR